MSIDRKAVDHVARLARLDLSDDAKTKMQAELSDILTHAEKIQSLDLGDVEPTSHPISLTNVMRDDTTRPSLSQTEALSNAPEAEDGRFKVPRIIEDA